MNCQKCRTNFADYFRGELSGGIEDEFNKHLAQCAGCREEAARLSALWTELGKLPERSPGPALDARVFAMLNAERRRLKQDTRISPSDFSWDAWLRRFWPQQPAVQFLLAALLFVSGLSVGTLAGARKGDAGNNSNGNDRALVALREEVLNLQRSVTVSLLQQSSASERLRGVDCGAHTSDPGRDVLAALLRALDSDANVNVRLAAVEALQGFAGDQTVRQGLLRSLASQDSPMVQIQLIDLMVHLRAKESVPTLQQLVHDDQANPDVRQRAEWGLRQLI